MKSKSHRISIPSILSSSPGSLEEVGYYFKRESIDNVVIFYDSQIKELFGYKLEQILQDANIKYEANIMDDIDICRTVAKAYSISDEVDAYVALGGGKVIDLTKYMAFLRKKPLISIPTSTSNDGFSSPVSSLFVDGKRKTAPAKGPYGIIVDIDIIANAPEKYIYSGIGDLVSNITALWDWNFEQQNGVSHVEDFAVMISNKSVMSFLSLSFKSIKDTEFLQSLVDSLIMNGIAMEISGSSAPASGSEHLISHAMDNIIEKPFLHGIQVGVATYIISILQNNKTKEICNLFDSTGFWDYVKTLKINKSDLIKAVDIAPTIKQQRHTTLHVEENREKAKTIIYNDKVLQDILI